MGVGPVLMGVSYDATHSYGIALVANVVILLIATMLIGTLGRYVYVRATSGVATDPAVTAARA